MLRSILNAYREAYGGLPREIWILSIAMFINRTGSMVIAFLTLYMTKKLGWSMSAAGLIFSVYGFGSIIGAYFGGRLVKKLGAIRIQIIGLIAAGPCYLAIPHFTSWTGFAVAVFLMSVFSEAVRPANNVAIAQFTRPRSRTQAYGLQRMAVNLGFSIGPAVGGLLAMVDYFWLFVVDGCFSIIGGLFLINRFGFQRLSPIIARDELHKNPETIYPSDSPTKDPFFMAFLGLYLMAMLVFYQFTVTYPKFMTDHFGMREYQIGFLYAVNTIIIVAFEMLLLNFVKQFNLLRAISWGMVLTCTAFGILPFHQAIWFAFASMVLLTIGEMLLLPLASTFTAERSNGRDQGMYMSYYAMTYSVAALLAPLIGSSMYEIDKNRIWYFCLLIGVVVFVGVNCLANRESKSLAKMLTTDLTACDSTLGAGHDLRFLENSPERKDFS